MKASEVRDLTTAELESKLKDLKAELFNLRFQLAINQLDNPMRISAVKKDIARVKTVLRENEIRTARRRNGRED
ncbi:MAG: 50S ribosomal protein L29 [Anaeromassilibacillus sp.]